MLFVSRYFKTLTKGCKSIAVGDVIRETTVLTPERCAEFSKMYQTPPEKQFVPTLLAGSLFSKAIGNTMNQSVYVSQSYSFQGRIRQNEELIVEVGVQGVDYERKRLKLRTRVLSKDGNTFYIDGISEVLFPPLQPQKSI